MNKSEYFDFQYEDIQYWLHQLKGRGVFAWDCGTGKTYVGGRIVRAMAQLRKTILIVVPNSLVEDWNENLLNLGLTDIFVYKSMLKAAEKRNLKKLLKSQIIITSYSMLHKIRDKQFDVIIADECHYIKSSTSKRGRIFRALALKSQYLLMMSGTVSQNRDVDELLNYLWCINDLEFNAIVAKNKTEFRARWQKAVPLPNGGRIYYTTKGAAELVNKYVEKYFRFRRLNDIVDLPERNVVKKYVNSTVDFKKLLQMSDYFTELDFEIDSDYENPHVIHALMLANGIDPFEKKLIKSNKIDAILNILDDLGNQKVIIWTWFKTFNKYLLESLEKNGYKSLFIDGTVKDRQPILKTFKESTDHNILIATVGTISEGHNLQFVNYEIHANIIYDSIKYEQASRRIYRIGQKNKVVSYHLIGRNSIERYAMYTLERKMSKREALDYLIGVLYEKYERRG